MVNDSKKLIFDTLTKYGLYVKQDGIEKHYKLIKIKKILFFSSVIFVSLSAILALVLAINSLYSTWLIFNQYADLSRLKSANNVKSIIDYFAWERLMNLIFFIITLLFLIITTILLIPFLITINKKVADPTNNVKRNFNFLSTITLIATSITIIFIIVGWIMYDNIMANYEKNAASQMFAKYINNSGVVKLKTIFSILLSLFFVSGPFLLFGCLFASIVFSFEYRVFSSFNKMTKMLKKLYKDNDLNEEELASDKKQKRSWFKKNKKEDQTLNQDQNNQANNNNSEPTQTKVNYDSIFKKMYNQKSYKYDEDLIREDMKQKADDGFDYTHQAKQQHNQQDQQQSYQQTQTVNEQPTKNDEPKVDANKQSEELKTIFEKINKSAKTKEVNNQTQEVNNQTQSHSETNNNQQTESSSNSTKANDDLKDILKRFNKQKNPTEDLTKQQQEPTTNVNSNPADIYKNIFKFKSPFKSKDNNESDNENN
ncbi:DUF4887 domain-containing protein [Mycoplasma sp. E35C]|uniref:DUF4887 domain-containing protein n=1 Tax=Mycoplasma sp. E35C TaxID=2801918 RepID=UPI001CA4036F|nr:DUF4887 domain-containing protein [Mycoplasma sp. E35C]QZX48939.1 hypothetical protein JJE79_02680 [Mycoplasma sp. E35C]